MKNRFPQTYLRFLAPATLYVVVQDGQQIEDATRFALVAYDQSCAVEFDVSEGWNYEARSEVAKMIGMERMRSALAHHVLKTGRMP